MNKHNWRYFVVVVVGQDVYTQSSVWQEEARPTWNPRHTEPRGSQDPHPGGLAHRRAHEERLVSGISLDRNHLKENSVIYHNGLYVWINVDCRSCPIR